MSRRGWKGGILAEHICMDYEDPYTAAERWAWRERRVDPAKGHFELRYGSAEVSVARVGRPVNRVFGVEFIVDLANPVSAPMTDAVVGELDFYLVTKRERNPWAYAQYHCGTAANLYSSVHWSFQRGEGRKGVSTPQEEDAMGLTAGKKAARTKKHKAAGAKDAATRKHRAAGKKAAQTRKRRAAGKKAAASRKRRAAAGKAAATRRANRSRQGAG